MYTKHFIALIFCCSFLIMEAAGQQNKQYILTKIPKGSSVVQLMNAETVYILSKTPLDNTARHISYERGMHLYIADPHKLNIDSLLNAEGVLFIQPVRKAVEEMVINGSDLSLNNIFYAHTQFPFVTGKGLTASIKESLPDTADIDFKKRFIKTGLEASALSAHATTMCTLIGGAGNTYYTGKG